MGGRPQIADYNRMDLAVGEQRNVTHGWGANSVNALDVFPDVNSHTLTLVLDANDDVDEEVCVEQPPCRNPCEFQGLC